MEIFNGEDDRAVTRAMPKRVTKATDSAVAVSAKRKVLSSESLEESEKSPNQIGKWRSPIQGRKMRSEGSEEIGVGKIERTPNQIRKSGSESVERNERSPNQLSKTILNDNSKAIVLVGANSDHLQTQESESNKEVDNESSCKEFGVCHIPIKSAQKVSINDSDVHNENKANEEEEDIEIKESFDIKEVNLPEPKKVVNEEKQFHQIYKKPVPISTNPNFKSEEYHSFQEKNSQLQSLVDLVMWKEVSRSAFVFGIGSFVIISSSYAKDINISFISVISYVGLFYLAATFLYRSIICRGAIDVENGRHVVGEEEAIWVIKLVLPYLNELLLKLRGLFCGDPATTMKLAVLLFGLARCGSSITVWKVTKWGFFGVFTVPKVCCSYSSQLSAYAKFWARRFRDAWESCSHKKGVALAIFILVWSLFSVVTRIWAAFMLFVAFQCYQQSLFTDEWEMDEVEKDGGMATAKQKKEF